MSYYPATVILADDCKVVVRCESSGQQIIFSHDEHNAVPVHLRQTGAKGFVSFPKAPPVFSEQVTEPAQVA